MTQEDINILQNELCMRMRYKVMVECNGKTLTICRYDCNGRFELSDGTITSCVNIKPYLRPMYTMTPEERKHYESFWFSYNDPDDSYPDLLDPDSALSLYDWLNENHFDYRYLIDKGYALCAPKTMYNIQ